jgi:eukaryotic-like serine/threonine-protein kinase
MGGLVRDARPKGAAMSEPPVDPSASASPSSPAPRGDGADPFLGARVGNCWIVSKLGEGGFGSVYRAIDETMQHPVAIKLVKPERETNEEVVRKFLRGAIAAAQVEHHNVVRIHRIGRDERFKLHYIVMEHLRGKTMQAMLDERGPLPWTDVIPWMCQAADGLHAAHEKSIIHRDVKPDNLMVGHDGVVKVTDLGLARMVNKEMKTTRVMGTPHFMAPEQFEGKNMDRRTDVFGFGISLYYLLSQQFPYEGKNSMQIVFAILTTKPKPLPEARAGVPVRLWEIILKMISRYPGERHETILEAKRALMAFADSAAVPPAAAPPAA